jgi:outer membrane immunogenic protein
MKRAIFIVATAVGLVAANAYAADLRMPVPPPVAAAVSSWTGFYIGVNGGYSWGRSRNDGAFLTSPAGLPIVVGAGSVLSNSFDLNGGVAGGQIGYNWQMSNWLVGLEGDGQWASERGRSTFLCAATLVGGACLPGFTFLPGGATGTVGTISQKIDAFGTFRGRVGLLITPEVLLYGTGGLAAGDVRTRLTLAGFTAPGVPVRVAASGSTTRAGWTAGAGIEGLIARNWSAKLEYLYMDLGTFNNTVTLAPPGLTLNVRSKVTDNILRAGVNYHF